MADRVSRLSFCLLAASMTACASAQTVCRTIDPLLTDPEITELEGFDDPGARDFSHWACIDPSRGEPTRLFVFIPGSGGLPSDYTQIAAYAADLGFASVSIAYPNLPKVFELLSEDPLPGDSERIRRERIYGEPLSDQIEVSRADSIENRLAKLLAWLDSNHPGEGWGAFIDPSTGLPVWELIVAAGHSQGAGHAAYLTRDQRMAGGVLFAGPGDNIPGFGAAPWLSRPARTPLEHTAGFIHVLDPITPGALDRQRLLGLDAFGDAQLSDFRPAAQLTSHMLVSDWPLPRPEAHGAPVVDERLPRTPDGTNVYGPVWHYLLQTARGGCAADLAAPIGVLDLGDVNAFIGAFVDRDPIADLADPFRVFDLQDVGRFVGSFSTGCDAQ